MMYVVGSAPDDLDVSDPSTRVDGGQLPDLVDAFVLADVETIHPHTFSATSDVAASATSHPRPSTVTSPCDDR